MSDHQCPYVGGLATCPDHPKWSVLGVPGDWFVFAPRQTLPLLTLPTWREAFDYAYTRATEATP